MYAYFKGMLTEKHPVKAVVECGGVGYEINIPLSTFDKLPQTGSEVKILIHYQFSENDGTKLYGFLKEEEKNLFRLLLGVSKVGPRTALAVLSTLSVEDFSRAVAEGNSRLISTVPGLGKKSSDRLILELKDKIKGVLTDQNISVASANSYVTDAEAALQTLGYSVMQINKTIAQLTKNKNFENAESLIKEAIRDLHKKRNK